MEKDDEVKGQGNSLNFGARIYDSRLGRWLAVDMAAKSARAWTPYRFGFDNPLRYKDNDGNWEEDGHFWTVYAMGIAMGMSKSTAREIAVKSENYDHYVHKDNTMSTHIAERTKMGKFLKLGTWADPGLQEDWRGLTGGPQKEVLNDAITRVLTGELFQMHKVGDAWAHSYLNKSGARTMWGKTQSYIPVIGWITLEHAFAYWNGGDNADKINSRPIEYKGYLNSIISIYNNPKFKYHNEVTNSNPDLTVFNYMQKTGRNTEENIFILSSYKDYKSGQKSFQNLTGTQTGILSGLFDKMNVKYEITYTTMTGGSGVSSSAGQTAKVPTGIEIK